MIWNQIYHLAKTKSSSPKSPLLRSFWSPRMTIGAPCQQHKGTCVREREERKAEDKGADKARLSGRLEGEKEAGKMERLWKLSGKGKRRYWGRENEMSPASPCDLLGPLLVIISIAYFYFTVPQQSCRMFTWFFVFHLILTMKYVSLEWLVVVQ